MAPVPDDRDPGPRPIDASLDAVSRRMGLSDSRGLGRLFAHWDRIVGEAMAGHVQPVRLADGVLVVSVDHPAWATQVRLLGDELLDRVADEAGVARPGKVEVRIRR